MSAKSSLFLVLVGVCVVFEITAKMTISLVGKVENCPNFDNKKMSLKDVKLERVSQNENGLAGTFEMLEDIPGPLDLKLTFHKFMKGRWIYFYERRYTNFCKRMGEEGQFWTIFTKAANMTSCPILKDEYNLRYSSLILKSVSLQQLAGNYRVRVEILEDNIVTICFTAYAKVNSEKD